MSGVNISFRLRLVSSPASRETLTSCKTVQKFNDTLNLDKDSIQRAAKDFFLIKFSIKTIVRVSRMILFAADRFWWSFFFSFMAL